MIIKTELAGLIVCKCDKCAHKWLPENSGEIPRRCASCKTTKWDYRAKVTNENIEGHKPPGGFSPSELRSMARQMIGSPD